MSPIRSCGGRSRSARPCSRSLVALGVTGEWSNFLLWKNSSGVTFGTAEPLFHRDPAFYVFSLPWLRFLQGWLFSTLVGVTILVGIAHVLWGGIRPQAPMFADKVTPAARAHLSVLLGLIMLVKAWGYWLGRFDLLDLTAGRRRGASYTDVKAQLPALNFLAIVAADLRDPVLRQHPAQAMEPARSIAVGAAGAGVGAVGAIYPAFVQQFRVKPNEQQYEAPVHRGQHPGDERRLRPQLDPGARAVTSSTGPLDGETDRGQRRHGLEHPRVASAGAARRTCSPCSASVSTTTSTTSTWTATPSDNEERVLMVSAREIAQQGLDPSRPDLAERPSGVHARVRRGRGAGQHGHGRRATGLRPAGPPPVTTDPALDMSQQPRIYFGESDRGTVRDHQHERQRAGLPAGHVGERDLLGNGRHPAIQRPAESDVRVEVPRLQPAGLRQHQPQQQDHDLPRHPDAGAARPFRSSSSTTTRTSRSSAGGPSGSGTPTRTRTSTRTRSRSISARPLRAGLLDHDLCRAT